MSRQRPASAAIGSASQAIASRGLFIFLKVHVVGVRPLGPRPNCFRQIHFVNWIYGALCPAHGRLWMARRSRQPFRERLEPCPPRRTRRPFRLLRSWRSFDVQLPPVQPIPLGLARALPALPASAEWCRKRTPLGTKRALARVVNASMSMPGATRAGRCHWHHDPGGKSGLGGAWRDIDCAAAELVNGNLIRSSQDKGREVLTCCSGPRRAEGAGLRSVIEQAILLARRFSTLFEPNMSMLKRSALTQGYRRGFLPRPDGPSKSA